jgi:hypothetical protein
LSCLVMAFITLVSVISIFSIISLVLLRVKGYDEKSEKKNSPLTK